MPSVFSKTLRDLRGPVLGWGLAIGVPAVGMVAFFPSLQDLDLESFLSALPEPIQRMVGDTAALSVVEGFLKFKLFDSWLPMLLSFFAILQGATAIAGEEDQGTLDVLMAQPIERWRVVLHKFAALAVAAVGVCALIAVGLLAGNRAAHVEADEGWLLLATFAAVPLALVFGALALLVSCLLGRSRVAMMVAGVALVWSLFLETLAPVVEGLQPWRVLSPMYYYGLSVPLEQGLQFRHPALLLALAGALLAASVWAFERRDLTV